MSKWLSTIGSLFGMIGVVIIFFYGFPQPSFELGVSLGLGENDVFQDGTTVKQLDDARNSKRKEYENLSEIGLGFIFVGFALQIAGVWTE